MPGCHTTAQGAATQQQQQFKHLVLFGGCMQASGCLSTPQPGKQQTMALRAPANDANKQLQDRLAL